MVGLVVKCDDGGNDLGLVVGDTDTCDGLYIDIVSSEGMLSFTTDDILSIVGGEDGT